MRVFRFALMALLLCTAAVQAAPGILQADAANVRENEGSVTVSISRRHGSTGVITVDYATKSASAVAGRDFTPVSGTLTFQDGEVSKSVTIAIIDNSTYDGNREFFLALSNPTGGATINTYPVGEVDLLDDEPPPNVSINDIRVTEGNSGTTNAEFTITVTGVTRSIDIKILWKTNDYSATAGSDFQSSGGTFVFTPADTEKVISVPVYGDTAVEDDERFNVYVYGGATFTKPYGYCTIVNDDSPLSVIIASDVRVIEGNSGTTNAVITLIANQSLSGVSINYATVEGTAVAGRDFQFVSGTAVFSGETQQQITIPIIGDAEVEADEQFSVHLSSSGTPVTLQRSDIITTIVNDDIGVGPATQYVAKGSSGSVIVDAGSAPSSPRMIAIAASDPCIEAPSSVTFSTQRVSIPVTAVSAPCSAKVEVTFGGKSFSAGIVTYNTLNVSFDPPLPKVYAGQTTSVRAIVSPFESAMTLPLVALGGTVEVPASIDVGANGGTFTIKGLAPGIFSINVAVPNHNGGGIAQLFGEVIEAREMMMISRLTPASGPVTGGTSVTLSGANFASDCKVTFGDTPANAVFVDAAAMTATTSAHAPGTVDVTGTCGSDAFTLPNAFTFVAGRRRSVR
jgi:hypothetical protein